MGIFGKGKSGMLGNGQIEWVYGYTLNLASWRTTYVLKPDLQVLARSMEDYGWLQPLIVQKSKNVIIDGSYRWQISKSLHKLSKITEDTVPVIYVDCDDIEAIDVFDSRNVNRIFIYLSNDAN